MLSVVQLIAKIKEYNKTPQEALIRTAYVLSKTAHGNQKRHSGELYFSHPLAVAEILIDLKLDSSAIVTGLLHDVVEDTEITLSDIEKEFGEEVAKLVDGVTKLGKIETIGPKPEKRAAEGNENFYKLALAMSEDIRVLLVKLADRLHNMRTLAAVPYKEKRLKKAKETLDIYAPLAARIGLNKIKDELQELAFAEIDPQSQNYIANQLSEIKDQKKDIIKKIVDDLAQLLKSYALDCEIIGREKKPYSIWMKMQKKNVGFHHLRDVMAFRIITKETIDCYRAMGIINSQYSMIPGSFKDYISTPKENGYQSLHLITLGPLNKKIEIQIRDEKMHEVAELGVATHWRYKENKHSNATSDVEKYRWIRELINLLENKESAGDAIKHYKMQMHKDEVFCFTPNGDVFNLPIGATVVDFAYAIHSEVGNSCVSAKINGKTVALQQKLENGDQVEILTREDAKPSANWLQFVITSKAKYGIRIFIKHEKLNEYRELGKAILDKFFASKSLELNSNMLESVLIKLNKKSVDEIYIAVAEGLLARRDVLKMIYPDLQDEDDNKPDTMITKQPKKHLLPIEGLVSGMVVHYAGCCHPIPGDAIIGIINTGSGVSIHNQSCHHLKNMAINPQRILNVCWRDDDSFEQNFYLSRVKVIVENKTGSLAETTSIIARRDINISNIRIANRTSDCFEIVLDVEISNLEDLELLLSTLRLSPKVIEVERG